jgi:hypothetical protein
MIHYKLKLSSFSFVLVFFCINVGAQELYVYGEPASNVPAKSLSFKYAGKWMGESTLGHKHTTSRQMAESSIGLGKFLMLRPALSLGNMYNKYPDQKLRFESASIYAKLRVLSIDDIHRHFRAAAFVKGVFSKNDLQYAEITADGDQTAIQGGVILTQLLHKLAISGTGSLVEVLHPDRWKDFGGQTFYGYRSFNYSLSTGYLLLPRKYMSYEQTNFNIYLELIGSSGLDRDYAFTDLAPAIQLIVNSNAKINVGYRFQISGGAYRMGTSSLSISYERSFLNAIKHKKNE